MLFFDTNFLEVIKKAKKILFIKDKKSTVSKEIETLLKKYLKKNKSKKNLTDQNIAVVIGLHPKDLKRKEYYTKVLYGSLQRCHKIFFIVDYFYVEDIEVLSEATLLSRVQRLDPLAVLSFLKEERI